MNPRHSSESVLMVVTVVAILIVAVALYIAFGPATPQKAGSSASLQENTTAEYQMTKKEKHLAAVLAGDSATAGVVSYRVDDDFDTLSFGYDLYHHGKAEHHPGLMNLPLGAGNRQGQAAVTLNGKNIRFAVSASDEDGSTDYENPELAVDEWNLPSGWSASEVGWSYDSAQKITKGKKIYLKTYTASKGEDHMSVPAASAIAKNPSSVKDYDYCYLFYIRFS